MFASGNYPANMKYCKYEEIEQDVLGKVEARVKLSFFIALGLCILFYSISEHYMLCVGFHFCMNLEERIMSL